MADNSGKHATSKQKNDMPAPIAPAAERRPVGLGFLVGINTATGKTTIASAFATFFEMASVPVRLLRIETGERRGEFAASDLFVDVNRADEAANLVGGPAALLDEVWPEMSKTIATGGAVVIDYGAGAQNLLLQAAAAAGLDELIKDLDVACTIIVVTTPDPECGRQAARLVDEARKSMPSASVVLAVNHINAGQQSAVDTPAQRSFLQSIADLKDVRRIDVPFARGQSIDCFRAIPMMKVLRSSDEELVRYSGKGQLSSRAAQGSLAAWYRAVSDQLREIYWR